MGRRRVAVPRAAVCMHCMRRVWRTLVLVVLGIATTVLTGWWFSHRAEGSPLASATYDVRLADASRRPIRIVERHWRGVSYVMFYRPAAAAVGSEDHMEGPHQIPWWSKGEFESVASDLMIWTRMRPPAQQEDDWGALVAVGWPWPAMRCRAKLRWTKVYGEFPGDTMWQGPGVGQVVAGGLDRERDFRRRESGPAIQPFDLRVPLPYMPIWPGLIGNTLVFASAWALILALPALAFDRWKVRRRIRRGECPKCRYSVKGLPSGAPCPECGASDKSVRHKSG